MAPSLVASTREARASQAIALLRVIVGAFFLYQGYSKLRDPMFAVKMTGLLSGAAANNPFFFYQDLLNGLIIPNVDVFAQVIIWGELLIGASYVSGALIRVSTVGQLFLNLNYLLALQHTHPGERALNLCFLLLGMTLLFGEAGRQYGLDLWIFKAPSKKTRSAKSKFSGKSFKTKDRSSRKSPPPLLENDDEDDDEAVELPAFSEKKRAKSGKRS
ncbi:MAG: DoxX family membrane protein [Vampirovibrionales bacterium]|nr:DoxX family membrane protein [Vampirovibrionales bacterium]